MIVLHNFLHWTNSIGENELEYNVTRLNSLYESILSNPAFILSGLFTYFGHFGVQLFVFVSAYGLTKKYLKANENIHYKEFILSRFLKIYSLVLVGLSVMFCVDVLYKQSDFLLFLKNALNVLLMINNFSYSKIFSYIGPWWFFSLILQLYLIFPFIYRYIQDKREKGFYILLAVSYLFIYVLFPVAEKFNVPLFGNFLGHLPEFLFGIALASFPKFELNVKILLPALFFFILSNISAYAFPFSFLSVTILLLALISPVFRLPQQNILLRFLLFTGKISMFLFVINGPLRFLTLDFVEDKSLLVIYIVALLHLLIAIGISYLISLIYDRTLLPLIQKVAT
jgi:peptidoglycan/LPS O-acetylase OafA/YrhL